MVRNKTLLLILTFIVLLVWIVLAVAGDGIKMQAPASGTNYSSISSVLFNVSFVNGTDITNPANATFFLNISGTWRAIGSTSGTNGCSVGATASSCAATITNTTIADGVYSLNATIYNATASISVTHLANLSNLIYIDGTVPAVFAANISGPANYGNYSQTLVLNASLVDATTGIYAAFFNITNNTGRQNSTVSLTREGTTTYYSVTINSSHYPDGYFNLTVYANDSVGNLNNSALVYRIIFDNTAPSITHSCNDYSVEEEDVITCSCSATDATSGLNTSYGSSGRSFTANPSTASTGTNFQTACTSQDMAGNSATSTLYYNVTGVGGNTGGNSGSTSSSNSSSSSTNQTNSTTGSENSTVNEWNALEGNQGNPATLEVKKTIIYFYVIGVIIVLAVVGAVIFLKKRNAKKFK